MTQKNLKNTENGFTLVEIVIVILIAGLITAAFVSAYLRWKDILQTTHTHENIAVIADAMSAYVSLNQRIPCPANPDPARASTEAFGTEVGNDQDIDGDGSIDNRGTCLNNANEWEGILPFATLGLDASAARDGWGNYFTYQVSPVFTDDLDRKNINIHAKCRTTDWIEGAIFDGSLAPPRLTGGSNLNHRKANFCCMEPNGDEINIYSDDTQSPSVIYNPDLNNWYDTVDEIAGPYTGPLNNGQSYYNNNRYGGVAATSGHTDMVVYAIISHGKTGGGAFLDIGGRAAAPQGDEEVINATPNDGTVGVDQAIYDLPHNSSNGTDFYDDIVHWQTQSNIMSRLKRGSCALP